MSARLPNAADRPERDALTAREIDVLCHLARGYSYSRIAESLGISPHTVTSHIKNAYRKLDVHSGAQAVYRALQLCLLETQDAS
jgi:DNA-binding CsgD family transcriptional regulator